MAAYSELSPEDQAVVQNTVNLLRAAAGEKGRSYNRIKAIEDDTNAINLLLSVDPGDTIPNTSGLAGADDMTRSELATLWNLLKADRDANDNATNRAALSKAAGINEMLR